MRQILIIGSGPIVIGQAAEFDYSGSQAARALQKEGFIVHLLNSNPATIMTDPITADYIHLRPLTVESVEHILREHPIDAVLPTMGGQTALNLAVECARRGLWAKYGVEVIGASLQAIEVAEDREKFRLWGEQLGLPMLPAGIARSYLEAKDLAQKLGYPVVLRPSFTLGGAGAQLVYSKTELERAVGRALALSPVHEVLVEKSVAGWKEFELEVMRDKDGNFVVVCTIENLDPMGIHTGDSITIAPAMTLPDSTFQQMRDYARKLLLSFPDFAGGCNVQFALSPHSEEMYLIEINPRVSRSSALASKATGYPIAKIAALLATGKRLDEITNPVTGTTSAFFEPSIDYVVVKIPRWNFDKFPGAHRQLGMQMRSVGEAMGIGRSFIEALQKAIQSLELRRNGLGADGREVNDLSQLLHGLEHPSWNRIFYVHDALLAGVPLRTIHKLTSIDEWFLQEIQNLVNLERELMTHTLETLTPELLWKAKRMGLGDRQIAHLVQTMESQIYALRQKWGIRRIYKRVDTCAAEFEAQTPYYYSTFEPGGEDEGPSFSSEKEGKPRLLILGSGPNRIGQGVEFDYCCVHGVLAAQRLGYEALMLNCNPETVSTDPDISDRLYFEPVFWEHVYEVIQREKPVGVVVQLGGQTPLKLAEKLHRYGIPLIGTGYEAIDTSEDRGKFSALLEQLGIPYPPFGVAHTPDEALALAEKLGYPVLVRPSYVLGGQRMRIVVDEEELVEQIVTILREMPGNRILIDRFLSGAVEVELDAISDGEEIGVIGLMEHIEPAGVHSGDSTAVLPPFSLPREVQQQMRQYAEKLASTLCVRGFINVQYAYHQSTVYVIEANLRASRTVPFLCKAHNRPFVQWAMEVLLEGRRVKEYDFPEKQQGYALKVPVFSFERFPEVEKTLGPEMRSTGEEIYFIDSLSDPLFQELYAKRSLYLSR
ncbi:MAG: carbamoyl-phosphate synthase large subunit [Bacteroidia bacterium]|nr:carbamoyl-phosphate synthase large subunit [Bacteroidia bacterium]MDW8015375.1 carbamoyl-phosphate synthase large subunit [Bacteroidia bacterium]